MMKTRMHQAATWTRVVTATPVIHKKKLDSTYQRLQDQLLDRAFIAFCVLGCNKCKYCEEYQSKPGSSHHCVYE